VQILNRPAAVSSAKVFEQYSKPLFMNEWEGRSKREQVRKPARMDVVKLSWTKAKRQMHFKQLNSYILSIQVSFAGCVLENFSS
jgi:hypothetical protein